jgi:M6 family metalloprotease-like protein
MSTRLPPRPASRSVGLGVLAALLYLATAPAADAQPCPPREGPYPEFIHDIMQRNPEAFRFKRSLIQRTDRIRENRRLLERGLLNVEGKTPDEVQDLITVSGTVKVPVFLGKYTDTGANPYPRTDLQTELFDGPWPTGTMTEYYSEISYGNLNVQGTVYDWFTVAQDDDYYAGNSCGLDTDAHVDDFITEIVAGNDGAVDFGIYDNDGPDHVPNSGDDDGYVDFIAIVHPELGGECSSVGCVGSQHNIWSHRWVLSGWSSAYTTNDASASGGNIKIDDYVIMPASSCDGGMIEIGVFCHEFGHAFGLPDLYDTYTGGSTCTSGSSSGVGWWDLMAAGNWNSPTRPAHMSAWSKAFLGWVTPGVVAFDLNNWPLQSASLVPAAYKLWTGGTPTTEYFLVEYRTASGFDDQIEAPGVLVWHVDEGLIGCLNWNDCNENECHKLLDLECADQSGTDHTLNADGLDVGGLNRGDAGDPFCNGDTFNNGTNPSSVSYGGSATNVQVTDIANCGGQSVRLDLLVGQDPEDVDLCMRDCGSDPCTEPSPCDVYWASPEVYIDNNEDGIIDPPAPGIDNKLFARVRNVGGSNATDVDVDFYFADPTLGLLFPSTGTLLGSTTVPLIGPSSSEPAEVVWAIPNPPPDVDHYCLGVIAENALDGQTDEFAPNDDNVAQINMQALYAKAGDDVPGPLGQNPGWGSARAAGVTFEATRRVMLCNPFRETCSFSIKIGSPPQFDDAIIPQDWSVQLEYTQVVLRPGECRPLRVTVKDPQPVHGDRCVLPLTLLCDTEVAGGTILIFEIDNVAPEKPCVGFDVVRRVPPEGDTFPGQKAIHASWNDNFADALGFPERVERWRLYNGTSEAFIPSAANLIAETCIDEDPTTTVYDLFKRVPDDPTASWYKIIAVDRAGNESLECTTQETIETVSVGDPAASRPIVALEVSNPFRAGGELRFSLPERGKAEVEVFSLTGRRVRELANASYDAGEHRVRWDGTDASGREAASGVYVVRVTSNGLQRAKRMLLIR